MSDKALRYLIASVIALLLIYQIGHIISALFGMVWGALSALAVAAVTFLSARMARVAGRSSFWFLLPTILFTVLPIGYMAWKATTSSARWNDLALELAPFAVGFALPIVLLLIVYYELRRRTLKD